jgi:hypothetical protein
MVLLGLWPCELFPCLHASLLPFPLPGVLQQLSPLPSGPCKAAPAPAPSVWTFWLIPVRGQPRIALLGKGQQCSLFFLGCRLGRSGPWALAVEPPYHLDGCSISA